MKKKSTELYSLITHLAEAPRELIVAYIKLMVDEAKELPANERESRGDYHNLSNKFPQTKGEDIASDISSCLATQDWLNWDSDPQLEEIGSIAGSLEMYTDDHMLWQELFERADKLQ